MRIFAVLILVFGFQWAHAEGEDGNSEATGSARGHMQERGETNRLKGPNENAMDAQGRRQRVDENEMSKIKSGKDKINGKTATTMEEARKSWEEACRNWESKVTKDNQNSQVLGIECGRMQCRSKKDAFMCTSKARYKVKPAAN